MDPIRNAFSKAVMECADLPWIGKERVHDALHIEEHTFDSSYIEFLDEQIRLNARGDEWSSRLRDRRRHLAPFVDQCLIRGKIPIPDGDLSIEVESASARVIHWEEYSYSEQTDQ
jgi:hypothetical protein